MPNKEYPRLRTIIERSGFELDDIIESKTILSGRKTIIQAKKMRFEQKEKE